MNDQGPIAADGLLRLSEPWKLEPDPERLRALLKARAEATGFEVAIVDHDHSKGSTHETTRVRMVICWPLGDEIARYEDMIRRVAEDKADAAAERIAAWVEEECRDFGDREGVSRESAEDAEVLGEVLASGIKAGAWREAST